MGDAAPPGPDMHPFSAVAIPKSEKEPKVRGLLRWYQHATASVRFIRIFVKHPSEQPAGSEAATLPRCRAMLSDVGCLLEVGDCDLRRMFGRLMSRGRSPVLVDGRAATRRVRVAELASYAISGFRTFRLGHLVPLRLTGNILPFRILDRPIPVPFISSKPRIADCQDEHVSLARSRVGLSPNRKIGRACWCHERLTRAATKEGR